MQEWERTRLAAQGFSERDLCECHEIGWLARWTPLACAALGSVGLLLHSPAYMLLLGALTAIGAVHRHSFYDLVFDVTLRPLLNSGAIPPHGPQRRFGCAIGATLFLLSGTGMLLHDTLLAYVPAAIIIPLALIAATTQWCFASALYAANFIRKGREVAP